MKILVVSPPTFGKHAGGAAKEIFGMVSLLKRMGHEVSFYCIGTNAQDQGLIDFFSKTYEVTPHIFTPNLERYTDWLIKCSRNLAYLDRASYVFGQLVEDAGFKEHVSSWRPDVVVFFCSYGWPVAQHAREVGIPSVFRSHNYEPGFFFEALSALQKLLPSNWIRYAAKSLGERHAATLATVIASIPFDDVWRYRRLRPDNIFIFTLTYLSGALKDPWVHRNKRPLDIMFLGASYLVSFHLRGAQALIEQIGPELMRRAPGAFRIHICGSKLPAELKSKCDGTNIIYEDYVPDLEGFLSTMDIGAFPVWTGKSMKGKVFESLARAFPVVIPHNCLGGYVLKDKEEVLMAETPQEFVEAILSLQDDALRERLSKNGRAFAQKYFSYEELTSVLGTILERARLARSE